MADYTSRVVTSSRYEWIVPAAEPWGAPVEVVEEIRGRLTGGPR